MIVVSPYQHIQFIVLVLLFSTIFMIDSGICSDDPTALDTKTFTLEEAIDYALENNRTLQSSALGVNSSELDLKSQRAEFDIKIVPVSRIGVSSDEENPWLVGATFSKQLKFGPSVSVAPRVGESFGETDSDVAFRLDVPLLRGAGTEFTLDGVYSSLFAYQTEQRSFYSQQENTVLRTVTGVYATIRSGMQIELIRKQLARLEEHLALVRIKEKSGVTSALDLYRAEIRIKNVQDELASFQEQHANNVDEVKNILAIPQSGHITLTAPVDYKPVEIDLEDALQIAQDNRIEIEQSERNVQERDRLVALAKNNLLPQLDLRVGYNLIADENIFELADETWTVSLNSDTDVFRTTEKNVYQQRRLQFRQAQLDEVDQKERINQEVRSEVNSLEKQQQRIEIQKEQVNQTVGKLRLAESKFRYGMANNFDLIEAQTELQEAQTNYLFARIDYIVGTYRLRSVLGTLLERNVEQ